MIQGSIEHIGSGAAEFAYPELWNGCVGAWAPCMGPTGATLFDWSVFQNRGTLTNMDPATDFVIDGARYGLDFDGTNDFVQISGVQSYATNGNPFSISLWAYVRTFTSNVYTKFVMLKSDSSSAFEFGVSNDVTYLGLLAGSTSSWGQFKSNTAAASITGAWRHYGLVYNGGLQTSTGSFTFYLDGVALATTTAGPFAATTNSTTLGYNAANNRLNGLLDDVRIYNRVLNPNEIALLARRRGIAYDLSPMPMRYSLQAFQPAWALRQKQILGGGGGLG